MIAGEGERLERERRRKFWRLVFVLGGLGAAAGFVFGFIHGAADAAGQPVGGTARTVAALSLIVAAIGGGYFSWRYFESADEVEVTDNLWASLIGFYVYGFGLPLWWGLSWLRLAPEPVEWIIYVAVMLSAAAAYVVRKWRSR